MAQVTALPASKSTEAMTVPTEVLTSTLSSTMAKSAGTDGKGSHVSGTMTTKKPAGSTQEKGSSASIFERYHAPIEYESEARSRVRTSRSAGKLLITWKSGAHEYCAMKKKRTDT